MDNTSRIKSNTLEFIQAITEFQKSSLTFLEHINSWDDEVKDAKVEEDKDMIIEKSVEADVLSNDEPNLETTSPELNMINEAKKNIKEFEARIKNCSSQEEQSENNNTNSNENVLESQTLIDPFLSSSEEESIDPIDEEIEKANEYLQRLIQEERYQTIIETVRSEPVYETKNRAYQVVPFYEAWDTEEEIIEDDDAPKKPIHPFHQLYLDYMDKMREDKFFQWNYNEKLFCTIIKWYMKVEKEGYEMMSTFKKEFDQYIIDKKNYIEANESVMQVPNSQPNDEPIRKRPFKVREDTPFIEEINDDILKHFDDPYGKRSNR